MAKADLLKEAKKAEFVPADASEDDFTVAELERLLGRGLPAVSGTSSATEPQVAPDGHVNLSQGDIDNRAPAPKE